MFAILFNVVLGLAPVVVFGGSLAAGVEDDAHHRRMFLLVYGLWALSLAMWNWMRGYHVAWIAVWATAGVLALIAMRMRRSD